MCACADGGEVTQVLRQATPGSSAVLSGLITACESSVLQPGQAHLLAWSLWKHVVATGHDLSTAAQEVLWHTQSGEHLTEDGRLYPCTDIHQKSCNVMHAVVYTHMNLLITSLTHAGETLLELYAHLQSGRAPALIQPSPDILSAVVHTSTTKQDWSATMAAALALAEATQPSEAAKLIAQAVDSMHSSGSSVSMAAQGMPVLQQAECHADVVKVATHPILGGLVMPVLYVLSFP